MDRYMIANIAFSRFSRSYMELKNDLPIRPSEMAVLNIVIQRDERYTPLMIADLLGVSKPMIAAHIRVLLKMGYILKEPSEDDGRSFYVVPTEKARELADSFNMKQTEYLKAVEAELGAAEFDDLVHLLYESLPVLERIKEVKYAK